MSTSAGPDPLSPDERRAILREHLEREKSRRHTAEAALAIATAALRRLALIDEMGGMGQRDGDPELKARCRYASRALEQVASLEVQAPMTEDQAEARAVCEHFYASHCYRGMSVRLCMTCHEPDWDDLERQLGGVRQPEPLTRPADEFAAVKAVARTFGAVAAKPCGCGPDQPCDAHAEKDPPAAPPTAPGKPHARAGTDEREPLGRLVHETRLAFNAKQDKPFGLLSWEERHPSQQELDKRIGHAVANYALAENAATYGISCTSCAARLDRASAERERAERAEARLAAIAEHCRGHLRLPGSCCPHLAEEILAVIGSEEEAGHGG